MQPSPFRRTAVAGCAVAAMLAGVLTACSSSNHNAASSTSASSAAGGSNPGSSNTPTGSVIKLGEVASLTGSLAATADGVADGITAWADYTNAHGGIDGHPVKVYTLDDQGGSPAVGLADAKTLVEQDHVVAFVGEASGSVEQWQSYVEGAGVPVVGGQSSETPFLVSSDFFATGTNVLAIAYGQLKLAAQFGPKLGFTYCAEIPLCAQAASLEKTLSPGTGVTVNPTLAVASTAPNYSAQCEALQQAGVNSYDLALVSDTALRLVKQCKTNGFKASAVLSDGTLTSEWLTTPSLVGTAVVGTDVSYNAIKQDQPKIGNLFGPNVVQGWVSGELLAKAVEASGASTVTSDSIKQGLYTLKGETLGGMTPPLSYTAGKASPVNCFFPETIQPNEVAADSGPTTVCAPDALVAAIAAKM
jgi:branched-chain amino acid transport system substrate-binding protein